MAFIFRFLPLTRIAEAHFFETHTVNPVRAPDMQMTSHNHLCVKPRMPVVGLLGTTPKAEAWDLRNEDGIFTQGPVIDNDEREAVLSSALQFRLALSNKTRTPFVSGRVGVRMQQLLVRRLDAFLHRPLQCLLPSHLGRPEAVVVKREDGTNNRRHLKPFGIFIHPCHEVVFGSQNPVILGGHHTSHVFRLAFELRLVRGLRLRAVELMVTWHPEDMLEMALGDRKGLVQRFQGFADCFMSVLASISWVGDLWQVRTIAGQDQAVIWPFRLQFGKLLAIALER